MFFSSWNDSVGQQQQQRLAWGSMHCTPALLQFPNNTLAVRWQYPSSTTPQYQRLPADGEVLLEEDVEDGVGEHVQAQLGGEAGGKVAGGLHILSTAAGQQNVLGASAGVGGEAGGKVAGGLRILSTAAVQKNVLGASAGVGGEAGGKVAGGLRILSTAAVQQDVLRASAGVGGEAGGKVAGGLRSMEHHTKSSGGSCFAKLCSA